MEKKDHQEGNKNNNTSSSSMANLVFTDPIIPMSFQNIFDTPCDHRDQKDEFMDILLQNTQDYYAPSTSSLFDLLQPSPPQLPLPHQPLLSPLPESSEVVNTPATPNSSSISSSSNENEAVNDDQQQSKTAADQETQEKTKKT